MVNDDNPALHTAMTHGSNAGHGEETAAGCVLAGGPLHMILFGCVDVRMQ